MDDNNLINNPDIEIFKTDDGSIGLYNKKIDEIYHSKQGAEKEAFEKFIEPAFCALKFRKGLKNKEKYEKSLKILDICYGIGYNTKATLFCFGNKIDFIDCVEIDENLAKNSFKFPFGAGFDGKNPDYKNFDCCEGFGCKINLENLKSANFFDDVNKIIEKNLKTPDFIHFYFDDIRKVIKILDKKYDIIFHDGFAPYKQPQLWSEDLIEKIASKMHFDSIYCTYNHSKPVLAALSRAKLHIGKVIKNSKVIATIASFNKGLILNPYDEFELKSLKTKSAITYKDKNLDLDDETIIKNRNLEIQTSKRQTLSSFLKENINK